MNDIHPVALFRYSVLGPLVSRADLPRGELKATLRELAARHYDIPGSRNSRLSEKTIEGRIYSWRRGGIDGWVGRHHGVERGQLYRQGARSDQPVLRARIVRTVSAVP
mgnify:CR=1 FL=1